MQTKKSSFLWLWILLGLGFLGLTLIAGISSGYLSGIKIKQDNQNQLVNLVVQQQYKLGLQDFQAGQYEMARVRFEYVISQNPSYPGVTDKLVETMQILFATATPSPIPPTSTPTPTPDLRPVQEIFLQAQARMNQADWNGAIELLISLRQQDPAFQVARIDGWLFMALRNGGVQKILTDGDLEGGLYALSLAENFGPLDGAAGTAREWARIFIIGNSFWEAYPEQAVYYYAQVASAAPNLHDASGWTAMERYRAALIQWGDSLVQQEDWCNAQTQYEQALSVRSDSAVQEAATLAAEQCNPATVTPEASATETPTVTVTPSPTYYLVTPITYTLTPTPTGTTTPEETPTPTITSPALPTDTETPTPLPEPPTPTPTNNGSTNP